MATEERTKTYVHISKEAQRIWLLASHEANRPVGRQLEVIISEWDQARQPASSAAGHVSDGVTGSAGGGAAQ